MLLTTTAFAQQQQPDPVMLQKAIAVLQQQRNQAMDLLANSDTRLVILSEENAKLKAEIEELKKKTSKD